ncbi:hypothetical protein ID866_1106 [Astraeus odoratus]|nr:hypothetical protein ID866_1106 [Astraeus odoratus]
MHVGTTTALLLVSKPNSNSLLTYIYPHREVSSEEYLTEADDGKKMPITTPYHSFALPYPIRVDNFTNTIDDLPPPYNRPALHLLTHTHSDHLVGLASKSFGHRVICSPDAKEMLLRHEVFAERSLYDHEYRAQKTRTYGHLKIDPCVMPSGKMFYSGSRDLLVIHQYAVPLNTPTEFELSNDETVTITRDVPL